MELTRVNRHVLNRYKKATKDQQIKMRTILKEQIDNLRLLYTLMGET